MKVVFWLFLSIPIMLASCMKSLQTVVRLDVEVYKDYCDGRPPTPKEMEMMNQSEPYANQKILLIQQQDTTLVETDSEGIVETELLPGEYKAYAFQKTQKKLNGGDSTACFEWKTSPDFVFSIHQKNEPVVAVEFREKCNPCTPPRP